MLHKRYFVLLPFLLAVLFLSGRWNIAGTGISAHAHFSAYEKAVKSKASAEGSVYRNKGGHKSKPSRALRSRAWDNDLELEIPVVPAFSSPFSFPDSVSSFSRYSSPLSGTTCSVYQLRGPPAVL